MEQKRFTKNDSGFICGHCGASVEPLGYTSRNHCPFCLWSLHADDLPGDRASECMGLMEPVAVIPDAKKGYIIVHRCTKCGAIRRNKAAHEAKSQPDDIRKLIALTAKAAPDVK
ncbi:MAG: RNHCP domain-containing protein [Eubacteriales bacterium]